MTGTVLKSPESFAAKQTVAQQLMMKTEQQNLATAEPFRICSVKLLRFFRHVACSSLRHEFCVISFRLL